LKVYGITCPGTQITHDLVELLDRKLVMKSGIKFSSPILYLGKKW
jgi:hypothetical protein